jgi:FtsZ-binding cell division protein ZapB
MTKEYNKIFQELRDKIKRIVLSLKQTKETLALKELELNKLKEEIKQLKEEKKDLIDKYKTLKTANSLISNDENQIAKLKISKMVKEIDKCIALLNS